MSNPSSRQQLIDYALRKLGHPVIEINIDDDQLAQMVMNSGQKRATFAG
jgi:hypothetical protein